jgi:hypothetical protein
MRKVERNIEKYGLDGLNEELHRRHQEGASLRDLATVINKRVLETALQDANATVVGDVESIYEALRGNEVSVGRRAAVSSQLKQQGVPMDEVEDDFVSHQTVRDHLQTCLDRDTARQPRVTRSDATDTIEWARSRCIAVIERTLTRLHDAGQLQAANVEVTQSIRVTCDECGSSYRLNEFVDDGGCDHAATPYDESPTSDASGSTQ